MPHPRRTVTLKLPSEFIDQCTQDGVTPEIVLRGFIADLCDLRNYVSAPRADGYSSHGSDERHLAQAYYDRVGYSWMNE